MSQFYNKKRHIRFTAFLIIQVVGFLVVLCPSSLPIYAGEVNNLLQPKMDVVLEKSDKSVEKEIIVTIEPEPVRAMKLLTFKVRLKGFQPMEKIVIDLSMPGMVMGINRFFLKRNGIDMYEGKTIVPTCPTGKKSWLAKVIIDHTIEKEVPFNVQ